MGKKVREALIALVVSVLAVALAVRSLLPTISGAQSPAGIYLIPSVVLLFIAGYYMHRAFFIPIEA